MNTNSAEFDFDADVNTLETIPDYFGRRIYVYNKIYAFKIYSLTHPDFVDNHYLELLELVGERLDLTAKLDEKKEKKLHQSIAGVALTHKESLVPEIDVPVENIESIRKYIKEKFCSIDLTKSKYIFRTDSDFLFISNLISDFCAFKHPTLLFEVILQPYCKTRLCPVLNTIYHRFRKGTPKKDHEFLNILSHLSVFEGQTYAQIGTDIMRKNDNLD